MIARGRGSKVIFTASLLTFQGGINVPGYAASKGAVGQLTMALSNEWAAHDIQVNAIARLYRHRQYRGAAQRSRPIRRNSGAHPGRSLGPPRDFAGPIVFLSSAASDYMTGAILTVDGGWMGR